MGESAKRVKETGSLGAAPRGASLTQIGKYVRVHKLSGNYENEREIGALYFDYDKEVGEFTPVRVELSRVGANHQRIRSHLSPIVTVAQSKIA